MNEFMNALPAPPRSNSQRIRAISRKSSGFSGLPRSLSFISKPSVPEKSPSIHSSSDCAPPYMLWPTVAKRCLNAARSSELMSYTRSITFLARSSSVPSPSIE